jgi:hypothetical protein
MHKKLFLCISLAAFACFIVNSIAYAATNIESKTKIKSQRQQKRLKTIPATVPEGYWSANAETNIYLDSAFENITVGYSANNGWDFSLSLVNVQVLGANKQFQGNTFLNLTKTFTFDNFAISVGSQNGVAMVNTEPQLWYNFDYVDNRYSLLPWLSLHAGVYLANAALTGTSRQVGFITGTEVVFIQDVALQVDYVSGHHSLSGATLNVLFNLNENYQIYLGVYVPEQNSGNEFSGTVGVNFSTKE